MDKCPVCREWTLAFYQFRGVVRCMRCGYERKVDVELWLKQHDILAKLVGRR